MRAVFIESSEFTSWIRQYATDAELSSLQRLLMQDPQAGAVMPGCGGLRKIRIADAGRGKGKRGGARVIYLHVPDAQVFYLITVYSKDQKDDLSSSDKALYRQLAKILKERARPTGET